MAGFTEVFVVLGVKLNAELAVDLLPDTVPVVAMEAVLVLPKLNPDEFEVPVVKLNPVDGLVAVGVKLNPDPGLAADEKILEGPGDDTVDCVGVPDGKLGLGNPGVVVTEVEAILDGATVDGANILLFVDACGVEVPLKPKPAMVAGGVLVVPAEANKPGPEPNNDFVVVVAVGDDDTKLKLGPVTFLVAGLDTN